VEGLVRRRGWRAWSGVALKRAPGEGPAAVPRPRDHVSTRQRSLRPCPCKTPVKRTLQAGPLSL
jgi:hypothetical protein